MQVARKIGIFLKITKAMQIAKTTAKSTFSLVWSVGMRSWGSMYSLYRHMAISLCFDVILLIHKKWAVV